MKTQFWISCILVIFIFCNHQITIAQELIPDPGFEQWDSVNTFALSGSPDWYEVSGTPDLHRTNFPNSNLSGLSPCPLGEGNTNCGYAYQGEAVLGCWKENGASGSREWGATQLTSPMSEGNCYKVSFWVQNKEDNPNNLFETNQWGLYFSETPNPFFSPSLADYTNKLQHIVMTDEVVGDTIWHYYEFDYQAAGSYQYVFVGYMGDVATSTFTAASNGSQIGFYAWFDEVSVIDVTPVLSVSNDTSICLGDSVLISAFSNYPVSWSHLNGDTTASFWAIPNQTTTYYVETQDSTDCSTMDSVTVTINPDVFINYNELICFGSDPFILDATIGNGTWSGNGITNSSTGLFDPNISGVGIFEIFYESANHCSENFTLLVEVNEPPLVEFEADVSEGCPPLEVQFTNLTAFPGITYEWDLGTGNISNDPTMASEIYNDLGDYDVTLTMTFSDHCSSTSTNGLIQVSDYPTASFQFSPNEISNRDDGIQFENTSSSNVTSLLWDFGDGSFINHTAPFHNYPIPGVYEVQLQVATSAGCTDSIAQLITVKNQVDFYIPNAFSPDGNGYNDYFKIYPFGLIENYKMTIFNRWGGVVFESNDLEKGWDGFDQPNGKIASEGVYVYVIEYEFSDFITEKLEKGIVSGDVTIIK